MATNREIYLKERNKLIKKVQKASESTHISLNDLIPDVPKRVTAKQVEEIKYATKKLTPTRLAKMAKDKVELGTDVPSFSEFTSTSARKQKPFKGVSVSLPSSKPVQENGKTKTPKPKKPHTTKKKTTPVKSTTPRKPRPPMTEEQKENLRRKLKEYWTPERRAEFSKKQKELWTPERRKEFSERMRKLWTEERRQQARERSRKYWQEKKEQDLWERENVAYADIIDSIIIEIESLPDTRKVKGKYVTGYKEIDLREHKRRMIILVNDMYEQYGQGYSKHIEENFEHMESLFGQITYDSKQDTVQNSITRVLEILKYHQNITTDDFMNIDDFMDIDDTELPFV